MDILFEDEIRCAAPDLRVVTIEATVENSPTSNELRDLMSRSFSDMASLSKIEDIKTRHAIAATREVYKRLGKEPNRYRPSAEALCRRIIQGKGMYEINTLVDLINLVSVLSGYSIGGFDMEKIEGERLILGAGRKDEPFEGIGRGPLNIEHLPVYRDRKGGIGTPTSDNERTKLDSDSRRLLMCINIYGEEMPIDDTVNLTVSLLEKFANAKNIEVKIFEPDNSAMI